MEHDGDRAHHSHFAGVSLSSNEFLGVRISDEVREVLASALSEAGLTQVCCDRGAVRRAWVVKGNFQRYRTPTAGTF